MRDFDMTAVIVREGPTLHSQCVMAKTLEKCKEQARRKWKWYDLNYAERYFYLNNTVAPDRGKVTTRWMTIDDE